MYCFKRRILVMLTTFVVPIFGDSIISPLLSTSWVVTNSNKSITIPAIVPGGIYSDLRRAGVLPEDIFYRFNDIEYRWVGRENWTYSTIFNVDPAVLEHEYVLLTFHGLDTISSIYLNGQCLGNSSNMFVRYSFQVKSTLNVTNNSLVVIFTSPIAAAIQYAKESEYEIPPNCVPSKYNGECHVNYLRKMQASFGWDWGPAFPSVGIWKNITLDAYDYAFARSVTVETVPSNTEWLLRTTLYSELPQNISGTLKTVLTLDPKIYSFVSYSEDITLVPDEFGESKYTMEFTFQKDYVEFWWPNGYGSQPLYELTMSFSNYYFQTQVSIMVGFRTVELVQENIDPADSSKGLSYYFKVNDVPIFAKGSNYIPAHILPELSSDETTVKYLLQSAKDANMNMLRVWGGGLYESDYFYKLCDEMGILVSQDMTFACSMYPAIEDFLQNVATEVKQQVLRLQSHPSLCLWTGNNENEAALRQNWYGTNANYSLFEADYIKLYIDTIRTIVLQHDTSRSFSVSTPSNGLESEQEGYVAKDPYSNLYGDVHYYNYYENLWDGKSFPNTRFASEYGIMSLPSLGTLSSIALPSDLHLDSEFIDHRQHHIAGYLEMLVEIALNMLPAITSDLENFIYLSQVNQAMSMKIETEYYRRNRKVLNSGEGMTMGAIYWQLNDVWQAPSWSSIEYGGKWKMMHYFAKDFFAPILVSPTVDSNGGLQVSLISDIQNETAIKLMINTYRWDKLGVQNTTKYYLNMTASSVTNVFLGDITTYLSRTHKCGGKFVAKQNCFLMFSLFGEKNVKLGPTNFLLPNQLKNVKGLKNATIEVTCIQTRDNINFTLTITTDTPAAFVWIDVDMPGKFSENGFLLGTRNKKIYFHAASKVSMATVLESLKIYSVGLNPQQVSLTKALSCKREH